MQSERISTMKSGEAAPLHGGEATQQHECITTHIRAGMRRPTLARDQLPTIQQINQCSTHTRRRWSHHHRCRVLDATTRRLTGGERDRQNTLPLEHIIQPM